MDEAHRVGLCDLCGKECDSSREEGNYLVCSYEKCGDDAGGGSMYHQDCIETYLARAKLEKNRKTGFKCPRGCGKGSQYDKCCPGKIQKSHPIHPRNEEKKQKLAAAISLPLPSPKGAKDAGKGKGKADADFGKGETSRITLAKPPKPPTAKPQPGPPPLPPPAGPTLAELKAAARRDMGLAPSFLGGVAGHRPGPFPKPPPPSFTSCCGVWGRQSEDAASTSGQQPQAFTLGSNPALQQLLQCSATVSTGGRVPLSMPATVRVPALAPLALKAQPPPPRAALSTPAAAPLAPGPFIVPVGMDYESEEEDEGGLTKAQKKNLKRAEKKKKAEVFAAAIDTNAELRSSAASLTSLQREDTSGPAQPVPLARCGLSGSSGSGALIGGAGWATAGSSVAASHEMSWEVSRGGSVADDSEESPAVDGYMLGASVGGSTAVAADTAVEDEEVAVTAAAEAEALHESMLEELCITALVSRKTMALVQQLRHLGLPEWLAQAAVLRHGGDLQAALKWVLSVGGAEGAAASAGSGKAALLAAVAEGRPEVDVSSEIDELMAVQEVLGVSGGILQQTVIDCAGDVSLSISVMLEGLAVQAPEQATFYRRLAGCGNWQDAATAGSTGVDSGVGPSTSRCESSVLSFYPTSLAAAAAGWHNSTSSPPASEACMFASSLEAYNHLVSPTQPEPRRPTATLTCSYLGGGGLGSGLGMSSSLAGAMDLSYASFLPNGHTHASSSVEPVREPEPPQRHAFLWERSTSLRVPEQYGLTADGDLTGMPDDTELNLLMSTLMCR